MTGHIMWLTWIDDCLVLGQPVRFTAAYEKDEGCSNGI